MKVQQISSGIQPPAPDAAGETGLEENTETHSLRDFFQAFVRHRSALIGTSLVMIFILLAIFAPVLTPYDY